MCPVGFDVISLLCYIYNFETFDETVLSNGMALLEHEVISFSFTLFLSRTVLR